VWSNLWTAKPYLKEGLGWRVGDGHSIRWIPKTMIHEVQTLARVLKREVRVSELIDFDTN
jgi:hypothetical protein